MIMRKINSNTPFSLIHPVPFHTPCLPGACCPTHVKLHRMSNHSMRVSWRSSAPPHQNYTVAVSGAGSNHTCTQAPSRRYCDVQNVTVYTCGDVYTVAVAPVNSDGSVVSFCPQRIYAGKTGTEK